MNCFEKGEIKFAIQKQYDLNKSKISGYEFLARMYLQNGTLISNDDLMVIKRMGVKFGQGYFLGKPEIM